MDGWTSKLHYVQNKWLGVYFNQDNGKTETN